MRFCEQYDKPLAVLFAVLSLTFILAAYMSPDFWQWLWQRHHNQWSWYIRPLFLIPFCWFAWRRCLAGVMLSVLLVLTSMGWFAPPGEVIPQVEEFLQFEQQYLQSEWTPLKVIVTAFVPVSLAGLAWAFWRRSLWLGLAVMALIAVAKVLWSVAFAGQSGMSTIVPAFGGLVACVLFVGLALRRSAPSVKTKTLEKRNIP